MTLWGRLKRWAQGTVDKVTNLCYHESSHYKKTKKENNMAEEQIIPKHEQDDLSRDDMSALSYVLQHVRGASPSSMALLVADNDIE